MEDEEAEEEGEDEGQDAAEQEEPQQEVDVDQEQVQGEEAGEQEAEGDVTPAPGPEQEDPEAVALKKRTWVLITCSNFSLKTREDGKNSASEFTLSRWLGGMFAG